VARRFVRSGGPQTLEGLRLTSRFLFIMNIVGHYTKYGQEFLDHEMRIREAVISSNTILKKEGFALL